LSNASHAVLDVSPAFGVPAVASIYALDGTVRRASSLQMTADARQASAGVEVTA
jgi:NADH-quinone oxidoreductase subunit G